MFNNKFKKLLLASSILVATGAANAGYEIKLSEEDKIAFGGYIKVDARYVDGDVAYRDFWLGAGTATALAADKSQVHLFANETRFNMKYTHGDVMGFIELDFWGGGGSEVISNSANPRIRHAFIKYEDVLVGQTWTTFMNTSAIPETADFAGPANGLAFIRQGQVRYTMGNFQVALENPYTFGGDASIDDVPDLIVKYTFKDDWGNISVAGLVRQLNTGTVGAAPAVAYSAATTFDVDGVTYIDDAEVLASSATGAVASTSETGVGYSIAGRIKTIGKDDIRFQVHGGNVGRYVGVVSAKDTEGLKAEETVSYLASYRHFWSEDLRSTVAYGYAKADISKMESTQWSVNLFKSLTKQLSVGVEVGNFSLDSANKGKGADSNYAQLSAKYVL